MAQYRQDGVTSLLLYMFPVQIFMTLMICNDLSKWKHQYRHSYQ